MDVRKRLSTETQRLLDDPEGPRHEFKETAEALHVEDLVAFANAEGGGCVLLGVSCRDDAPTIVGCAYDDSAELAIRQKAAEADPPIRVDLRAENVSGQPCVVVTIPQSTLRPHCSPRGRYVIRDGNKNRALKPAEMLTIFLQTHSGQFLERFRAAGEELARQFDSVEHEVKQTSERIQRELTDIFQQAQSAAEVADEAMTSAGEANAGVEDVGRAIADLTAQIRDGNLMLRAVVDYLRLPRPEEMLAANATRVMAVLMAGTSHVAASDEELLGKLRAFPPAKPFLVDLGERKFRVVALEGFAEFRSMPRRRQTQYRKSSAGAFERLTNLRAPSVHSRRSRGRRTGG